MLGSMHTTSRTSGAAAPHKCSSCAPSPEPTSSSLPLRRPDFAKTDARTGCARTYTGARPPSTAHQNAKKRSRMRFDAARYATEATRAVLITTTILSSVCACRRPTDGAERSHETHERDVLCTAAHQPRSSHAPSPTVVARSPVAPSPCQGPSQRAHGHPGTGSYQTSGFGYTGPRPHNLSSRARPSSSLRSFAEALSKQTDGAGPPNGRPTDKRPPRVPPDVARGTDDPVPALRTLVVSHRPSHPPAQ